MQNLKIAKNTAYQLASRGISTGLSILLSILLVRFAGLGGYGDFSVAVAFIMIFVALSDFGSTTIILREFSNKQYLREHFYSYLVYRVIIALLSLLVFGISLAIAGYNSQILMLLVLGSPLILLNSFTKAFFLLFQSKKDFKHQFISSLISGFAVGILLLGLYITTGTISSIFGIMCLVISTSINLIYLYLNYRAEFDMWKFKGVGYLIILFKDSWIIGLTLLVNMLMVNIDRVIMSKFLTSEDIGIYSLAYKVFEIALIIPTYIMNIYYPILLDSLNNKNNYYLQFTRALKSFFGIGIIVSVAIYIFAPVIVILWGGSTGPSIDVLRILSFGTLLFYISSPISWYLIGAGKRYFLLYIYIIGLVVNIILNLYLIPRLGYIAAAYITLISELLIVISLSVYITFLRQTKTKNA